MKASPARILVIDADPQSRGLLHACLTRQGHAVTSAGTGQGGLELAAEHLPDLIILELVLPDFDGLRLITWLRDSIQAPILVVSNCAADPYKVQALDLGADDYLTKPFSPEELGARIRVVLRHSRGAPRRQAACLNAGDLTLDPVRRIVRKHGCEVHLTPTEYALLCCLMRNPNRVLSYEQLIAQVWGKGGAEVPALRVHMANLRGKIEPDPASPQYILTQTRIGYRFRLPVTATSPEIAVHC